MGIVAVDTETVRSKPWSVQTMGDHHCAPAMWYCADEGSVLTVKSMLEMSDTLTVLHNAKFDLRINCALGIHPSHCECTMQMAYLIGEPRLSLKVLAYRIAGIDMPTYTDVTSEATQAKALEYLQMAESMTWPDPDPVLETKNDGSLRVKYPQNIGKKIKRRLKNYSVDPTIDLYDKWHTLAWEDGRGQVEMVLGKLERAGLDEVDGDKAETYAKLDAEATYAIYPYLHARIEELGLQDVLERDMSMLPMVMEMEDNGVLLDKEELESLGRDLDILTDDTQADIDFLAGHYVNPRSSQQVVALLQDEGIYTDLETSTDASVLDQYRDHTIVGKIQDYRAYTKLQSTYVRGLAKSVGEDGRIHTQYSTTRTETGRLASSKPNLQNIPVRTELGRRIRKAFVAEEGCSFLAFDYSQIELRVSAHESQDPTMMDIYWNDGDIHMTTACTMFGLPPDKIDDKAHRRPAKTVNFGALYLISAKGLIAQFQHEGLTQFTEELCQDFLDGFRTTYPGFYDWVDEVTAEARRTGMVRDMFGRIRFVPEINSSLKYVREAGIRQAVNAPIQSGAGGILKEAMWRLSPIVNQWRDDYGVICRPLLQIHDELIFEVEDEYLPIMAPQFHEVMCTAVELTVPVKVDCEVGKNWKELGAYDLG